MTQRIFVYGTLKRGLSNSGYMRGQTFVAEARTEPVYRLYEFGGYPGMVPAETDGISILGEIYDIDPECRARLDELEDVAHGTYELVTARLLPPFADQGITTYLYRLDITGKPDAGDEWRE